MERGAWDNPPPTPPVFLSQHLTGVQNLPKQKDLRDSSPLGDLNVPQEKSSSQSH